ncbi:MetQ/NlpA family ABC transporter substrate-binding protein [Cytobacillus purgationiresistens]|uniref:Lipoprotein n=1 Tax=Cytobacillus purgationiresistens TaxID=863449 RepID=A0ABU0AC41_9BACI|nr:MetQ/NlpA family ABC transporter substrate-binding protein [Cytobacillus purgationiresistens]MDQ0268824.1 D-methionine transport system substrate-binding protein [Cytobacillus purgationiresistens]
MSKKLSGLFIVLLISLVMSGCAGKSASSNNHVKIGVTGSDGQYWNIIKERAKEEGIDIELVEFSDYTLPNKALANGELDVNSFQHLAFLSQFIVENDVDIKPIGSTIVAPMGLYSEKFKTAEEIPANSTIAIPNDPANTGRGLKVLEKSGLIKLKDDAGLYPTPDDIVENPKNIEILTVVAQQTPRVLPDVAASIINSGIAGQAGLLLEDAIFHDDPHSEETRPYLNVFAVRSEDIDNETYKTIAKIYQEERVIEAVKEDSNGANVVVDIPVKELQSTLDELISDIKAGKD